MEDSGVFICHVSNGFGSIDVTFLVYIYGISSLTPHSTRTGNGVETFGCIRTS